MAIELELDPLVVRHFYRQLKKVKYDLHKMKARKRYISTTTFNLNIFSEEQSLKEFRFRTTEIGTVADLIGFTIGKTTRKNYFCNDITAACIVLRRLAAPCRWSDLEHMFGMRMYKLSEVFWEALNGFVTEHAHLIETFRVDLMNERAQMYAEAIHLTGAPLDRCVGFMDGTKIQMERPGGPAVLQRAVYSGHKRFHCLVYQSITTPDGLIFHMYGPEVGRRHDITLYRDSNIDAALQEALEIDLEQFYIYADQAYMIRPWLQVGYNRAWASPQELAHNSAMNAARTAVEWTYKDVKQMWTSQDYKRMLKVRQAPISLMYKGAALLWNIKICLQNGGQTQHFFKCAPPSLQRYLQI